MKRGGIVAGLAQLGLAMLLACTDAIAQPYLPAPGGAPGADTGDGAAPFAGLADTPSADLFSGAATTRIPITVPPGRGRATPSLALQYSSSGGASAYGYGWSLPIPRISRSARHGVPRFDDTDTFVIALGHVSTDLVRVGTTQRYRTDPEGAYLRIGFDRASNTWRVVDKSGTTYIFGSEVSARLGPGVDSSNGTAAWQLSRSIDSFGNHVDYTYLAQADVKGEGLPLAVRYGGNLTSGIDHPFGVLFSWYEPGYPSVAPVSYQSGYASRLRRLLLAIEVVTPTGIARRYTASHDVDPWSAHARLAGVSLDAFAPDADDDVALPSTVFTYTSPSQHDWPLGSEASRRSKATVFASPGGLRDFGDKIDFDTFDIDGDSIVDYVSVVTEPPTVRRGTQQGFGAAQPWQWPANSRRIRKVDGGNDLVVNVFDLTGDGLPDLVDARANACGEDRWCVYRNISTGFETSPIVWRSIANRIRGADVDGRTVRSDVADMNGDGRPDLVDASVYRSDYRYWHVYKNDGRGFDLSPIRFPAETPFISRSATDGDRSYLLCGLFDMNGDGLPDFVDADVDDRGAPIPISVTHWDVYLNNGSGLERQPIAWRIEGSPQLRLHNYVSSHLAEPGAQRTETYDDLLDMNGDGKLDWLRYWSGADLLAFGLEPLPCESGECSSSGTAVPPACCFQNLVFVNTGSSFSFPLPWAAWHDYQLRAYSKSPSPTTREFDLFDFDGDALVDLVEIEDGEWRLFRHPASPASAGSVTPASKRFRPNLLVAMMNGIGGETRLEYSSVAAIPGNRLPFPAWVVRRQETFDGVTATTAGSVGLTYRDAAYDADDNELRGFGLVWQTDALGRVTATEFHQDDLRAGLVERVSVLGRAGCASGDILDPANPCSPWRSIRELRENTWPTTEPVLLSSYVATPFHGGQPIAELAKSIAYSYDAYGNVAAETVASPSAGTVVTETAYAHSVADTAGSLPERYIVDRVVHTRTYDAADASTPLSEKRYGYDSTPLRTGALTSARACIEWTVSTCKRWQRLEYQHDEVGNVLSVRGPSGGSTWLRYDPLRLYAARIRNALGAETSIVRDLATGQETQRTLPDGQVLKTSYDGLGRPRRHYRSGASTSAPEIESTYFEGTAGGAPSWVRTLTLSGPPIVVFHDGLGRLLATKRWTETEAGVKAVVSGYRRYSREGALAAEGVSFEAPSSALTSLGIDASDVPAWTEYLRDADGRIVETRLPDGSSVGHESSVPGVRVTVNANVVAGTNPGSVRIELLDGFERVWRRDDCRTIPSPGSAGTCANGDLLTRSEYEYDGLDRVVRMTTGANTDAPAVTELRYDGLGNRTDYDNSNLGHWSYAHDDAGLLVEALDPRGARVQNFYDKLGRLYRQIGGEARASYKYYRRGPGAGLVRRIAARSGATKVNKEFLYDQRGRVVTESWRVRAEDRTRDHAVSYTYDDGDRRTSVSYPGATPYSTDVLRTEYTPYGLPYSTWLDRESGRIDLVNAVSYDLYGHPVRVDYGNGWSDRFAYTAAYDLSRPRCMRTALSLVSGDACAGSGGDLRREVIASRDAAGNVLAIDDSRFGGTALDRGGSFAYDALGRLVEHRPARGDLERFAYDDVGNLIQSSLIGALSYSGAGPNLAVGVGGAGIAHDAAGNRTRKGAWEYRYDALGRLSEVADGGLVVSRNHYDEGMVRVARYDAESDDTTFSFGGLVEVNGDVTTRFFHFMGRVVAADTFTTARTTAASGALTGRSDAAALPALMILLGVACTLRSRRAVALVTIVAFAGVTTIVPLAEAMAAARSERAPARRILFFHADERGSPELLTDESGALVERRRYSSYGRLDSVFDGDGQVVSGDASTLRFNGHAADDDAELVYFGSRFYDPELGLFLTPDPQAQFASPYLYGGGNPIYGVDADGEAIFAFLAAVLQPIIASAVVSSFVSAVTAAAQGGDIAGALVDGFVSGAAGAALGTALGGANVAYQYAAGGAEFIELGEALGAVVESARRAAFTNVVSRTAAAASRAIGADSEWATVVDFGTKLIGSYLYDNFIIKDSGLELGEGGTQRAVAKNGLIRANTTVGHTNVTQEAAVGTGWESQSAALAKANVSEDGVGGLAARAGAVLNNQAHFGRLPATFAKIRAELDGIVAGNAGSLLGSASAPAGFANALGAASHYVQDHLTLGHMVPGTILFTGPAGAPVRFVIHQVFGGEIAFRSAQVRATRSLLLAYGAPA